MSISFKFSSFLSYAKYYFVTYVVHVKFNGLTVGNPTHTNKENLLTKIYIFKVSRNFSPVTIKPLVVPNCTLQHKNTHLNKKLYPYLRHLTQVCNKIHSQHAKFAFNTVFVRQNYAANVARGITIRALGDLIRE